MVKVDIEKLDANQLMELTKERLNKFDKESLARLEIKIKNAIEKIESRFVELEELMYDDPSCDWKLVYDDEVEKVEKLNGVLAEVKHIIGEAKKPVKR